MFDTKLTPEEEIRANAAAGTVLAKLFRGTAIALKGTGLVLDKSTHYTAAIMHATANGIDSVGQATSGFCYSQSDKLNGKADELELRKQALILQMQQLENQKEASVSTDLKDNAMNPFVVNANTVTA